MKITTKLKIIPTIVIGMTIASAIIIWLLFQEMRQKEIQDKNITSVIVDIFKLDVLMHEYLLHLEERPREQWKIQNNTLSLSLNGISLNNPKDESALKTLRNNLAHINAQFSRLISLHEDPDAKKDIDFLRKLDEHLQSRIELGSQNMIRHSIQLHQRSQKDLTGTQKRMGWFLISVMLFSGILITFLTIFISRIIFKPISELSRATEIVGSGNLDFQIASKRTDELGRFSKTFDQMVSCLKEAMVSRATLQAEVKHLDRVATMGTLTAALAHEINQPLTAILSNAQAAIRILNAEQPDFHEVRDALHDIVSDDKRAAEVIRRLRRMLKKEELKSEALELNVVIQEIVDLLRSEIIIINASIAMDLDAGIPDVYGDRIQIQQVILNLLVNAFDAVKGLPEGTREVRISTRVGEADSIRVSVSDSGPGIEAHKPEAVFEAFYTTKNKGMGMGLPISKSIIEQHDGRIWASDNPEGGAVFAFTLPVSRPAICEDKMLKGVCKDDDS